MKLMFRWCFSLLPIFPLVSSLQAAVSTKDYSVQVSAAVQTSPPQIQLSWPGDANATAYTLYRKSKADGSWGGGIALSPNATGYTDNNVAIGETYEYQIVKAGRGDTPYTGYGYIFSGIQAPLIEQRGKLILVVDNTYSGRLSAELARLSDDLVGDGWSVVRRDVGRNEAVANVRALIRSDYNADPGNIRAVLLFGHVPVPYSGNIKPDGHDNHKGAWPADVYYADMTGNWTDSSVNNTNAERRAGWNVPGDGKFDQDYPPGDARLEVGRVDLSDLSGIQARTGKDEGELLRQYLNKDHNWRHAKLVVPRRALVYDVFGFRTGDPIVGSAYRNFSAFFGAANIAEVTSGSFVPRLRTEGYLWLYAAGGGQYFTMNGVGDSNVFATNDLRTVFTMFLGSYFGDWNNENNWMRSALAGKTYTITAVYAGFPQHYYHHMALGETIGYGIRLTQNNRVGGTYSPTNQGEGMVHIALMGDPTLRLHPVIPPANLRATVPGNQVNLAWAASRDTSLQGYYVYRAASRQVPFVRVSGASPVTGTTFSETHQTGVQIYMVRAVKLERSASGTYFNPSQGIFVEVAGGGGGGGTVTMPLAPASLTATAVSETQINLSWNDRSDNEAGFIVEQRAAESTAFTEAARLDANATSYHSTGLAPGSSHVFRVRSFNGAGVSAPSNLASARTQPGGITLSKLSVTVIGQGRVTPDLNGRDLVPGRRYSISAVPTPGNLFAGWSGGETSSKAGLVFVMRPDLALTATFIPDPFVRAQGIYLGLIPNSADPSHSGFLNLTINRSGAAIGRVYLGTSVFPVTGRFNAQGEFGRSLPRGSNPPLQLSLHLPDGGSEGMPGTLADGAMTLNFSADRAALGTRTNPAPQSGKYTLGFLPATPVDATVVPPGSGFAFVNVDISGRVRGMGSLADGTPINFATALSRGGAAPFYLILARSGGAIFGTLRFSTAGSSDIAGEMDWFKSPGGRNYPGGFSTKLVIAGSHYSSPPPGARVLILRDIEANANMTFRAGNLSNEIARSLTFTGAPRVSISQPPTDRLVLSVAPANGLFTGQFFHPDLNRLTSFRGAILQKQNIGVGYFLGSTESGSVELRPVP